MEFKMISFEELLIDSTRNGISKPKSTRGSGVPMINMGELFKYNRIPSLENLELVPLTVSEIDRFILKEEDLLFARRSLTLEGAGKCSIYLNNKEATFESSIIRARIDKSKANPQFYYYYFSSQTGKALIQSIAEQVAVAGIRGSDLKKLKVHFVDREIQDKIVQIMSAIDDKIEINSKTISNLVELAQTLFKRWFVDFEFSNEEGEPYKSSGGEMIENEIGNIPKGWKAGTLNDLGRIVGGGTPSKKVKEYYTGNDISWITPKDLSNDKSIYIYNGATDITEEALKKSSANLLPKNTILFSSRAPIGYVAIAGKSVATNQGFKSIVPANGIPSEYIFFLLKHLTPAIEANAGGSTFKEISGSGMKGIKTVLPPSMLLLKYKETVESLFEKIKVVEKENKVLIDLRDTLLPKLLSGEIELPDETEVTEHVPIP